MATNDQRDVPVRLDVRASDGDRERVVEILREHTAAGRLTAEELDERLDEAYGARTLSELDAVARDLPRPPVPRPERPERASQRRALLHGFPLAPGFALLAVVVAVVAMATDGDGLWLLWPLGFLWLKAGRWRHQHPRSEREPYALPPAA